MGVDKSHRALPFQALTAAVLALAILIVPSSPALADSIRDREWHLTDLHIDEVHRITDGTGVTVALIDTGVDALHQDLQGAVLGGTEIGFSTKGGAGTGTDGREDIDGHGTEMAGIIAGRGHGNGAGILGIAPGVEILPIHAPVNLPGSGNYMMEAIDFAIAHHASIINMSFVTLDTEDMRDALRKAGAANIVLIAGVGNNHAGEPQFPGKYDQVLTVGAYDRAGAVPAFSVNGPQVDIVAPGVDIVATSISPRNSYVNEQGTSDSTAIVSGAAALLRAKHPDMSATEIVHRLTATATDAGPPGKDDAYGYGRLNIVKALTADVPPLTDAPASATLARTGTAATSTAEPSTAADASTTRPLAAVIAVAFTVGAILLIGLIILIIVFLRRRRS